MTTITMNDTYTTAPVVGRLTFNGVLKGEWIKLLSLRSIRWSILVMLVLSWAGAALLSLAMSGSDMLTPAATPAIVVQSATFGSMFTVLIMGVLGALSITSEYASGLILSSLTAALADEERGFGKQAIEMEGDALLRIASIANGDCRNALNALELAVLTTSPAEDGIIHITPEIAAESSQRKVMKCDEQLYYDMLSAFCKSLRGGDSDAALAWFARLIYAGVDARIIARRLIAHASEDIGLANPQAMVQAVTAAQALELIGMPEAGLSLSQAIIFLCESPKSNAVVLAKDAALADAATSYDEPVPVYLRDTSYRGAKKLGHGKGYKYPHDYPGHWVQQDYMPQSLKGKRYYEPSGMGAEAKILENHIRRDKARRGEPLD